MKKSRFKNYNLHCFHSFRRIQNNGGSLHRRIVDVSSAIISFHWIYKEVHCSGTFPQSTRTTLIIIAFMVAEAVIKVT